MGIIRLKQDNAVAIFDGFITYPEKACVRHDFC